MLFLRRPKKWCGSYGPAADRNRQSMQIQGKATRIRLFDIRSPQMRAFHVSWFAFFLCFFAWFGIAPLMPVVREELGLTPGQIGNLIVGSVAATVVARLAIGRLCDRFGPRLTYAVLLVAGSVPVMGIGLAQSYESFLLFRILIGIIGASFVITQYHTSLMFAPNVVGTANATTAGWGNMGGGVAQLAMPLLFTGLISLGTGEYLGWRLSMVAAGFVCMATGVAYYFLTQDTPGGNFSEVRPARVRPRGTFAAACRDRRVWALFVIYAACFGIELTVNNVAALYFGDYFGMTLASAGAVAALFGLTNLFARTLGGYFGDRFGRTAGLRGRTRWLWVVLVGEGLALVLFSRMTDLAPAIVVLVAFSLLVQMSEGATFSVVPFVNKQALGSVAGIVGAGGNVGAVLAGFLFRGSLPWSDALLILGVLVTACSFLALTVRFSAAEERAARVDLEARLAAEPPPVTRRAA